MQSAEKIVERLMIIFGVSAIPELAKRLAVAQTTVYSWIERDSLNLKTVFAKCENVNLHWLLTGEGLMSKDDVGTEEDRHALVVGREFIALVKKAQELGTNSGIFDSTADCRLPRPDQNEDDDRPFVMPGQQRRSGPPPKFTDAEIAERFGHRPYVAPSSGE